ncbi:MAG: rhodanese-like domain-containing protein [Planctomycetota bacterium]|jgi:rhodanese-related sulfurtransferase/predicted double-glycine peptidase
MNIVKVMSCVRLLRCYTRLWMIVMAFLLLVGIPRDATSLAVDPPSSAERRPSQDVTARELGAVETENAGRQRYCGVHAVVLVARMLGKHIEVSELLDNDNVSSARGSTLADLCRMIDGAGFKRQVLADASVGWLESLETPAILHIRGQLDKPTFNHWIVFGGVQDGKYRLIDAAIGEILLGRAELLSVWEGVAIEVVAASSPKSFGASIALAMDENVQYLIVLTAIAFLVGGLKKPAWFPASVCLLFCSAFFLLKSDSMLFHQYAVNCARPANALVSHEVESISHEDLVEGIQSNRLVLVDARTSGQFEHYHIPGAISLPIDASALEYLVFCRDRQSDGKLVVTYCNGVRCRWADQVAKRLVRMDVQVQVYSGGIERWNQVITTSNK